MRLKDPSRTSEDEESDSVSRVKIKLTRLE